MTRGTASRLGVLLLVLAACAMPQTRREAFVSSNPALSNDIKAAITRGDIVRGMTPADVRASWGEPQNIVNELLSNGKNAAKWYYERPFGFYVNRYEVHFVDDRVVEVRANPVQPATPSAPAVVPPRYHGPVIEDDVPNARHYLDQRGQLQLTPEQVQRLEAVRESYRIEYRQKQDLITLDRNELANLQQSSAPDQFLIKEKTDDIGRLQNELRNTLVNAMQTAGRILTPAQQQLLQATGTAPVIPRTP